MTGSRCRTRLKSGHGRQGFAFQHFKERAARRGNIIHLTGVAVLLEGCDTVAAAGNRIGGRFRNGLGDGFVPLPNWSISNAPTGPFQTTVPASAMSWAYIAAVGGADIKDHVSRTHILDLEHGQAGACSSSAGPTTTSTAAGWPRRALWPLP